MEILKYIKNEMVCQYAACCAAAAGVRHEGKSMTKIGGRGVETFATTAISNILFVKHKKQSKRHIYGRSFRILF